MRYEPKTDQQLAQFEEENLLPPGTYYFEVFSAQDTTSKNGNEMTALKLQIESSDGRERIVHDYLVATDAMAYKLKHFAESVGLESEYNSGNLPAELMQGRTGQCKLAIQKAKDGYRAKNTVADYVKAGGAAKSEPAKAMATPELDDEIPF